MLDTADAIQSARNTGCLKGLQVDVGVIVDTLMKPYEGRRLRLAIAKSRE
jgi:hypothetical protein